MEKGLWQASVTLLVKATRQEFDLWTEEVNFLRRRLAIFPLGITLNGNLDILYFRA